MKPALQAFRLSRAVLDAITWEEIESTYRDMEELGLAQPPYEDFDIVLAASDVFAIVGAPTSVPSTPKDINESFGEISVGVRNGKLLPYKICDHVHKGKFLGRIRVDELFRLVKTPEPQIAEYTESAKHSSEALYRGLLVLLATRNITKTLSESKLVRLGIGKSKGGSRNRYTTTIELPRPEALEEQSVDNLEPKATGRTLRAHLRRGHIRRQHYGPAREFLKKVWIAPVFVNADENFINARTAYNLHLTKESPPCKP